MKKVKAFLIGALPFILLYEVDAWFMHLDAVNYGLVVMITLATSIHGYGQGFDIGFNVAKEIGMRLMMDFINKIREINNAQ